MGCGSSAQKKVVAQPQPVPQAQQAQNATKTPAQAAPPPAAAPAPAPAPVPAPVKQPIKSVTPDAPPKPKPMALDPGDEPMAENEALAGKLYSPKAGSSENQGEAAMKDLLRQKTEANAQTMLMGDEDPPAESALMENAALDGQLYSPRYGDKSNQDEGAPADLMGPSAPPAAELLEVGPEGGGKDSALMENAVLEGALYSPRGGQEKPAVDLMGGESDLNSEAKNDLMGSEEGGGGALMENLALDGALYSPKGGGSPPGGAGQDKHNELVTAHEQGSTVVANAALKGDLYSPRGGGEEGAVPDLMGGGDVDDRVKEGLKPDESKAPALMENAALSGALFSPRAGEPEGKHDVMGDGAELSAEAKEGLKWDAPEGEAALLDNAALQGALFSPRGGAQPEQEEAQQKQEEKGGEAPPMENAALQGALYSPRAGEGGGGVDLMADLDGPGKSEGAEGLMEEGAGGGSALMENAALDGALYSPRAAPSPDPA